MVFTTLCVDDFLGMEFKPNTSRMDYLFVVSEVGWLKSLCGEEDNLIAEQDREFCIKKEEKITHNIQSILSTFPTVLDYQENSILDFVVPKGKRSMPNARPRKVTEHFLCNGGESMIKKAVENNNSEEQESGVFKINWGAGVRNQEFFRHKKSQKHEHNVKAPDEDWGNTMSKITLRVSANFAFGNPKKQMSVIRKRAREVTNHIPLGFNNQDRFLNEKLVEKSDKEEAAREKKKAKRNIIVRATTSVVINRILPIEFKNAITEFGGCLKSAILVIEKTLFETDVKPAEGRLSIPQKEVTKFLRLGEIFLNPEEEARLSTRIGGKMSTMSVTLIEPSRKKCKVNLRKWFMNKDNGKISSSYVLVTYWNEVVRRNALKSGTLVQLWAFRKGEDLCFALVKV
ncbi:hypothetical protein K7X08_025691 [Anisodus acutangulus]|uniref:B3 domain-containing protein n=1 Tax=Anisodus acutangulus TaxID=402998 RepID=A0A9Q1LWQ5_9SOLA|nr:hypothetical protein K7X08_025691 [Anisodus acutangulus]